MRKKSKRVQRPILLPLGMKRLDLFEFPKHAALLALGQPWMTGDHLADLLSACELGMELGQSEPEIHTLALQGMRFLLDNVDRSDMTIKPVAHLEEMRHVLGQVVQWITYQPNRAVHDAVVKRLKELNESERVSQYG